MLSNTELGAYLEKWTSRFNELMSGYDQCWVIEEWMHS